MDEAQIDEFINFTLNLKGDEKGEAQLFLDHLFRAFGHRGVIEAEATLEHRIKIENRTKFCDLMWPGRVLIEMKKRGEKLEKHFTQAKTYWDNSYSDRTKYVILCNFDEFRIYNWNIQKDCLDIVPLSKLKEMWSSLSFLFPEPIEPVFGNNLFEVTKEAADGVAHLFNSLIERGIERNNAQRFVLQCLVSLFAEDNGLFPDRYLFTNLIEECRNGQSSYDLFPLLFTRMNSFEPAKGGRFKNVPYFNGGLFTKIEPIELTLPELEVLAHCAQADWSKIQPSIFGNIFEDSLSQDFRHRTGAHYTAESDIMRIVEPTILRNIRNRIYSAKTLTELNSISDYLGQIKILDPACGSGNFLFIAFRELKALEIELYKKILEKYPSNKIERLHSKITTQQFYGFDTNTLGVELAKVTLSMAKKFSFDFFNQFTKQFRIHEIDKPLPFDNLDDNIRVADALFTDWPDVDFIIGNPPYQSKNKMQQEFGADYIAHLREKYPDVPGKADYCVYWFRIAHSVLPEGGRAGLVGTNTIRQNNSRIGGLDYIVNNNGFITEAVGSMPWSGAAVVHVSIVNWIKGQKPLEMSHLAIQTGNDRDSPWLEYDLPLIPSSLSPKTDVTNAESISANNLIKTCFQGQTHGHEGFLLSNEERQDLVTHEPIAKEVTFPYLIADEMIGGINSLPKRWVIDFQPRNIFDSKRYHRTFEIIEQKVLPDRKSSYEAEKIRNEVTLRENPRARVNHHHENFYNRWWLLSYGREDLIEKIKTISRYISCGQVTKRPIFDFISSSIRPNAALMVFTMSDDFSFGILQSSLHWIWFTEKCSTLTERFRYTSDTVYSTFPWPQWGSCLSSIGYQEEKASKHFALALKVAEAGCNIRRIRSEIRSSNPMSLRDIYRTLELPGKNSLRDAHIKLDKAVWNAYRYGIDKEVLSEDPLAFLLKLNHSCAEAEREGKRIFGPGLPPFCNNDHLFFTDDCIELNSV